MGQTVFGWRTEEIETPYLERIDRQGGGCPIKHFQAPILYFLNHRGIVQLLNQRRIVSSLTLTVVVTGGRWMDRWLEFHDRK